MEKKNYTAVIDLGSSNVVVAVATRNEEGTLDVEAIVSKPVEGVNAGRIVNIEQAAGAIREAVTELENDFGMRITEAYAGISGEFVRCARHTDHVFTLDPQNGVIQSDVDALFDRMRNVQAPDDEVIVERIPQLYLLDEHEEVRNPVGSFCRRLSSTFNFILCDKTPLQRLDMALRRLGIRTLGIFPNVLATPEAVLSDEEKEEGVAVVDLGGGVTDVTVYCRGIVRYAASIPMGAKAINRDIRSQSIPEKHVESLKCKYGSAVAELAPEDKLIRVSGRTARESKAILLRNLATVIEARAMDIVDFVRQEIEDSGCADKLGYGIVLTGGSARLKDLDELFRRTTGMEVRVATAETGFSERSCERLSDPAYATAAGLLLRGMWAGPCNVVESKSRVAPQQPEKSAAAPAPQPAPHAGAHPTASQPIPPYTPSRPAASTPRPPYPQTRPEPQRQESAPAARTAQPYPPQPGRPVQPAAPREEPAPPAPQQESAGAERQEFAGQDSAKKERNWKSIFKKTLEKINEGFNAADDEEI